MHVPAGEADLTSGTTRFVYHVATPKAVFHVLSHWFSYNIFHNVVGVLFPIVYPCPGVHLQDQFASMITHAPPTPPMSESNVRGVASSVLEISDLAAKVSVRLFALSRKIKDAIKPIEALSKDIASTGAVLNQLGHQLKKGDDVQVGSSTLVTSVDDLVEECSNVFDSIDKALDGNNSGSKAILGLQHYVHLASLEPQLVLLETNLERLRTPLALMLNVLIYAEQLKGCVPSDSFVIKALFSDFALITVGLGSQERSPLLKEQQELIKVLNEERKNNERRFHKLTTETKTALEDAGAFKASTKEPSSTPETANEEARDGKPRARGRIWIKAESPEPEDRPRQNGSSTPRARSATRQIFDKAWGRVRIPESISDVPDVQDDDPSLIDMASFLKSRGPHTPRTSGDTFGLPVESSSSRFKYEPREAIVRGHSSDLINFFREASPLIKRMGSTKKPRSITPVRNTTGTTRSITPVRQTSDPITPPLTGRDETAKKSPLPPLRSPVSPTQSHLRSQSAGLPSPLGSHPPEPQTTTTRPATTKWPLQAVLSWLEQNSFSTEWQQTFQVLQIQGSEFVELESGQSIRKMLTVIYPQLAKECSESGKGWDQAQERAEGQRMRKLIRELPVDVKYEDASSTTLPEKGADTPPAICSPAKAVDTDSRGRRRAVTAPTEDITPRPTQNQARNEFERTDILPLPESEEEHPIVVVEKNDDRHRGRGESETSNVPDEWVRKWTVLSSEEIARGKEVGGTWLVD